ncbi:MAG: HD domain-containing protein [Lachnospiraceae bacterium]|nr:HD domain-containing protein [Lachnospiraceae bacterium]
MKWEFKRKNNKSFNPAAVFLIAICTTVNVLLYNYNYASRLPFYFDTIGTITATALGGTIPGIFTAFLTNAVNFVIEKEAIYYASLNMMIAILAALFFGEFAEYRKKIKRQDKSYKKDYGQKRLTDTVLFIMVLAFVGGGIGGGITWFLYGTPSDKRIITDISEYLSKNYGVGMLGCHMISTYIADVMDKAISVCISMLIIRFIPQYIKDSVRMSPWKQKPITIEEQAVARKKRKEKISIGTRINLIIIASTLLMMVIALVFYAVKFRENTVESLASYKASQTAYLASQEIDPEKVAGFLENGNSDPAYDMTKVRLSIIKNGSSDITFLYVYKIQEDGCHVIFDLDTVLSDGTKMIGDPYGTLVKFENAILPYKEDLLDGKMIPAVQMDDEYGSFLAAYYPVYDKEGKCVCYAVSNIDKEMMSKNLDPTLENILLKRFMGRILFLFVGFLILIVAISMLTTKYHIVMPITSMTMYANEMTDLRGGANEEILEKLEELDINTDDEVEQLYKALCRLTGETVYRLNDNASKAEAITKMQNVLIITMADMVESRDSDTGAHVLKTAAYVRIILQGLKRNGYYAEKITDKYMRDVEMSAPLHDVGKINISDTILNKPGKLTKEEFEIMKTHTTAGKNILENAISSMEGDNYLKEARNMAAYHHERWDGKGYPEGLHGEVIPLSARVMAVADVFDALSSPRVYKPAFPFDEAMQMIKDGAGTQFDPKCVEVFAESVGEIKKVLKRYQE